MEEKNMETLIFADETLMGNIVGCVWTHREARAMFMKKVRPDAPYG